MEILICCSVNSAEFPYSAVKHHPHHTQIQILNLSYNHFNNRSPLLNEIRLVNSLLENHSARSVSSYGAMLCTVGIYKIEPASRYFARL